MKTDLQLDSLDLLDEADIPDPIEEEDEDLDELDGGMPDLTKMSFDSASDEL